MHPGSALNPFPSPVLASKACGVHHRPQSEANICFVPLTMGKPASPLLGEPGAEPGSPQDSSAIWYSVQEGHTRSRANLEPPAGGGQGR